MADPLAGRVGTWLDRQAGPGGLIGDGRLGLAYSGGGDSHALLVLAARWAQRTGRQLTAFHVDHRLRPESGAEARQAQSAAARLGVEVECLAWTGDKPASGLAAAARQARHGLLARACRQGGISCLLLGHTADDRAETALMLSA